MKIKKYVWLLVIIFLMAMSNQKEVVPFLQSIVKELKQQTKVPLILPTYWDERFDYKTIYPGVSYNVDKKGYTLYFFSMNKPYPPNHPIFKNLPEANRIGSFSGSQNNYVSLNRPNFFVSAKEEKGIPLWKDARFEPDVEEASLYGEHKKWHFKITGMGTKNATRNMTRDFINNMNDLNWLDKQNIEEGRFFIQGTENANITDVHWRTKDGYVYSFFYRGGFHESIKIMNGTIKIKKHF